MTKRLLLASFHYPPSERVGARRPAALAEGLAALGYEVDVVCSPLAGIHGPPRWRNPDRSKGSPSVLDVPVPYLMGRNPHSLPTSEPMLQRWYWKIRAHAEWRLWTADYSWRWGAAATAALQESRALAGYDALIADGPPFPSLAPFARAARADGLPIILDLRDLWLPRDDQVRLLLPGLQPRARRSHWLSRLARETVRDAEAVIMTSPAAIEASRKAFPEVAADRFANVYNSYAEIPHQPEGELRPGTRADMRLVYAGSLAYGRDVLLARVVEAIAELASTGVNVKLRVLGGPADKVLEAARDNGVTDSVHLLGWTSKALALEEQLSADALVLLQSSNSPETEVAIPAKLFDYMACRRHILSMATAPANRLVEDHDLGIATQSSVTALATALVELTRRVQRRRVLPPPPPEFSQARMVDSFAQIVDRVLSTHARRS